MMATKKHIQLKLHVMFVKRKKLSMKVIHKAFFL